MRSPESRSGGSRGPGYYQGVYYTKSRFKVRVRPGPWLLSSRLLSSPPHPSPALRSVEDLHPISLRKCDLKILNRISLREYGLKFPNRISLRKCGLENLNRIFLRKCGLKILHCISLRKRGLKN